MAKYQHTFPFNPLLYTQGEDREHLVAVFEDQKVKVPMDLRALRRGKCWAVQLPTGVFLNEYRVGVADFSDDLQARDSLLARIRESYGYQQYRTARSLITKDGVLYYHQNLINLIAKHADVPSFFRALDVFLRHAQQNPELIKGKREPRPFMPPEERMRVLGHRARGPAWSPAEDQILRQWFGKRTVGADAGMHVKLTDEEWTRVLELLGGRRTQDSVRGRISVLNKQLARELAVNGYVPRDRMREYMSRVLGERPWRPRIEPRSRRPRRPRESVASVN